MMDNQILSQVCVISLKLVAMQKQRHVEIPCIYSNLNINDNYEKIYWIEDLLVIIITCAIVTTPRKITECYFKFLRYRVSIYSKGFFGGSYIIASISQVISKCIDSCPLCSTFIFSAVLL